MFTYFDLGDGKNKIIIVGIHKTTGRFVFVPTFDNQLSFRYPSSSPLPARTVLNELPRRSRIVVKIVKKGRAISGRNRQALRIMISS